MAEPLLHPRVRIDLPLDEVSPARMGAEIAAALAERPRRIPSKYFYDDRGSELFERITELPEYYPTRAEASLLAAVADEVVALTGARALVELGSGAATKTLLLLDAMERAGGVELYVPVDVSESTLRRVAGELVERYPRLAVHGVVGDFLAHLETIPDQRADRLVIFLGGTIGNLAPPAARAFVAELAGQMSPGEPFLLGVDLIKDPARLLAAYDDAAGVTAAFNRNALAVANRILDADFDPSRFRHHAPWNAGEHRIEMWLVAEEAMVVELAAVGRRLELAAGEPILTEISTKYDEALTRDLLEDSGFRLERWFTAGEGLFGLALARRR
jgi:L-histidine N-alpha-methyltransferase